MLSRFRDDAMLARYGVALRYYMLALMSLGVIHAVLLPKFARVEMQDYQRQREFTRRWLKYSPLIALPIIAFDLAGRPIFVWINGRRYDAAFDIWIILSVGIWLGLVASPFVNILISRQWYRTLFALGALGLLVGWLGNVLLIPRWDGCGTAVATVAGNAVINVTSAWLVWRHPDNQPASVRIHEA
jgi:O-antigen/teichoic acid export membrane protein